jgi:hypothetical protein
MDKLINKHLIKIINEYVDYKLNFLNELKKTTIVIHSDVNSWRYYSNRCIRYDDFCMIYSEGYNENTKCRIIHDKNWYCFYVFD